MTTIKDVAKQANVSVATVSRVMNNGEVNAKTKELVLATIKELNYQPNELARSLYRKSAKIIGIIIPDLKNEFFNDLISGIEEIILKNGFKMMLCTTRENPEREQEYLQMASTNQIDGLIICSNLAKTSIDYYKKLNIPAVTLERMVSPFIPSIATNNHMGGELAAKQLIKRHCHEVVQFCGPQHLTSALERSTGFLAALKSHSDIHVHTVELDFNRDSSMEIKQFLMEHPFIDGIFAASDYIAAQSLRCLKQLGRRVPDDVQLIGYDNVTLCDVTNPPLSTIAQPIHEMGELAATTLFGLLQQAPLKQRHIQLPVTFVERESTIKVT